MDKRLVASLGLLCVFLAISISAASEVDDVKPCPDCELAASLQAAKEEERKAGEMEQYAKNAEAELEQESSRASDAANKAKADAEAAESQLTKAARRARNQEAKLNQEKIKIEGLKRRTAIIEKRKTDALDREQQTAKASAQADASQAKTKIAEEKKAADAKAAKWQLQKQEKLYDNRQKKLDELKLTAGDAKASMEQQLKEQATLRANFQKHAAALQESLKTTSSAQKAFHTARAAFDRAQKRMREQTIVLAGTEHSLSGIEEQSASLAKDTSSAASDIHSLSDQASSLSGEMKGIKDGLSQLHLLEDQARGDWKELSKMTAKERRMHEEAQRTLQMEHSASRLANKRTAQARAIQAEASAAKDEAEAREMEAATEGAALELSSKRLKAATAAERDAQSKADEAKRKHIALDKQLQKATKQRKAEERIVHRDVTANIKPGSSIQEAQRSLKLSKQRITRATNKLHVTLSSEHALMDKVKKAAAAHQDKEAQLAALISSRERSAEQQQEAAAAAKQASIREHSAEAALKGKQLQATGAERREQAANEDVKVATAQAETAAANDQVEEQKMQAKEQHDVEQLQQAQGHVDDKAPAQKKQKKL